MIENYSVKKYLSYACESLFKQSESYYNMTNRTECVFMIRIMLCCASGMSTSLLVEKMLEAARDKEMDCDIWAVNAGQIREQASRADVIMLGPQVRYAIDTVRADAGDVPVALIGMKDYGMMDGEAVLEDALALYARHRTCV